jgi:hypothetical protein
MSLPYKVCSEGEKVAPLDAHACVRCGHRYAEPMTDPRPTPENAASGEFGPALWFLMFVLLTAFFCMAGSARHSRPAQAESQRETAAPAPRDTHNRDASADRDRFWHRLHAIDPTDRWLVGVSKGITENDARITVSNKWHEQNFHFRRQLAHGLWKIWANIHRPARPDQSLISLVDGNGNPVGGSSGRAGSMLSVDKE